MPFLRFSRDPRGYESTYLCHTFRRTNGPPELRVLYWFRSPPDVKIGRAALAPDVIRAIEESNPGLRFDWDKILKVKPPPPPDPGREEREERRNRRRRGKEADAGSDAARPARAEAPRQARKAAPPAAVVSQQAEADVGGSDETLAAHPATHPVADVTVEGDQPLRHIVLALTDEEGLARLRARHAEIQTRIGDRFRDPVRLKELRSEAAQLDPDGWGSIDEARERIASLDETTAALRKILGRRRRTRRGGARRRRGPSSESGATAESASEAPAEPDGVAPAGKPSGPDADADPTST